MLTKDMMQEIQDLKLQGFSPMRRWVSSAS